MTQPPDHVIEVAREAALRSPCEKSKRGAVLFDRSRSEFSAADRRQRIVGIGYNGQPEPFSCNGSEACRAACGKLCLHAEQRAILGMSDYGVRAEFELVHVKVVDGVVVPGGGPSCWQCSRLVVEVGIRGVWLYEFPAGNLTGHDLREVVGEWRFYLATDFHRETAVHNGLPIIEAP
jgi:deoxycytidylate deaminase